MVPDWNELIPQFSDCCVCKLDPYGLITYASPSVEDLTGYRSAELVNKPFYNLNPQPSLAKVKLEYEMSLAAKSGTYRSDELRKRKDGTLFWTQNTLKALYDENGVINGFTCMLWDITERKNAENELRQSEERFRIMVDAVRDYAIFMLDKTGHIVTWNEGAHRIKGYAAREIIGKHFSIFYTREDLDDKKPERELRIAIATGKYEEEGWRVRKNGTIFWANVVITALFNENNEHIGFSKVTRDLSERKQADEKLRQSEERNRVLVEQVKEYGIFMLDEKGRIISWNEGALRINGYEEHEVLGKYFSIFYLDEDKLNNKPQTELRIARETGKFEEEGWRLRKNGAIFWANVVITALKDSEGRLIGYSKVTRDLSERRVAEKALRESYEQQRNLAAELTHTNRELAAANEELEQFTSIVSHDLQEPVRTIKSFLQLIERKLDNSDTTIRVYVAKATAAANRMRELIRNLLHYSQLAKEKVIVERVDVNELVNEVIQNLGGSIEASGARIKCDIQVRYIQGYAFQLSQLLQNLVSNALKFNRTAHPEIWIANKKENDRVIFSVSDNGIGIARSDMDKIFEIFRRLDTHEEFSGTGVGLAISKKIVERHNGAIWVESEPGKGSTFYFSMNTNDIGAQSPALEVQHEKD